jgi:hypothetical protein
MFERYEGGLTKVYLAEFKNKNDDQTFYKVGYTQYKDAADRFNREGYENWNIRILSTILVNSKFTAQMLEKLFHLTHPKNVWVDEKFSGVTEIVQLERPHYLQLLNTFRTMNAVSKKLLNEQRDNQRF